MQLLSQITSLLFINPQPLSIKALAKILEVSSQEVEEALVELIKKYNTDKTLGLQILRQEDKVQMVTAADNSKIISKFINEELSGDLTLPQLETLAIIAYRGPLPKLDIDTIRGVNCSIILRNLIVRGLIEESINSKKNESFYTITLDFLRLLGISSIKELPEYERLNTLTI